MIAFTLVSFVSIFGLGKRGISVLIQQRIALMLCAFPFAGQRLSLMLSRASAGSKGYHGMTKPPKRNLQPNCWDELSIPFKDCFL